MSHHYIQRNYGDHCFYGDNAWKRKQRYDSVHGDTLIFNFGHSCGYGGGLYSTGCCGGSFWGGFAHGLGLGIANLFSGFMSSMFMPMFGGNMFGGGFFGGMNTMSPFGMAPGYLGLGGSSSNGKTSTGKDDTEVVGDGGNRSDNAGTRNLDPVKPAPATGPTADLVGEADASSSSVTEPVVAPPSTPKLGNIDIPGAWKTKNISADDIAKLDAIGVKIIEDVTFNEGAPGLSLPKNGLDKPDDVKKLVEIADRYNIPVAFAKNTHRTVEDNWMAGKITVNDDGTYEIACQGVGMLGLTVKVSRNTDNSGWTIEHKSGTPSGGKAINTNKNTKYTYNTTAQHLETDTLPVYSKNQYKGYTKVD